MQIFPRLISAQPSGSFIKVTFDIVRASDSVVLAQAVEVSSPTCQFSNLVRAVQDRMAEWLSDGAFAGDHVAALGAAIASYTDADWQRWGI